MVYVIIPCFPFSFYSPYIILLRTVLLIPKVSHGKPELPTVAILILLQLRPIGPYSSIISGKEESDLVGVWLVWNFGPLCQRWPVWPYIVPSRNMPVLICLRKELWTGLISVGDQVPTCPVFTRAKIKSHLGILVNLPSQLALYTFSLSTWK